MNGGAQSAPYVVEEMPAALDGERVDRVVSLLTGCSRSEAAALVDRGGVRVGDVVVNKGSHRVREGEVVTLAALKVRPDLGVDVVVEELPRIVGGVPLAIRQDGSGRVALGYAASTTEAVGLTLDPVTLDAARAFSEEGSEKVLGVLPLSRADGGSSFATSRAQGKDDNGGLVALSAGIAHLSAGERGFQVRLGENTEFLWQDAAAPQNTSPRAEPLGSSRALATWPAITASMCWTAWNFAIGRPNWIRSPE